jgi:hypothetical protein
MHKSILTTLLLSISIILSAQDFDRLLEKDIKTEINLNRIAKSQNPLELSSFYKTAADSITAQAFRSYVNHTISNSLGVEEDWTTIEKDIKEQCSKYSDVAFNVQMLRYGDYKKALREDMLDKGAYYYKLENQSLSLSALRHGDKVFLTTITW